MSMNIRYRLIQFVEILLWLGAAAGAGQIASRLWNMRDQGWRAMLDVAVPGLLGIGAGMAALIVLIGIYHNTRRQGEALHRIAKQGAGGMRRLPGAARNEVAQMAAATPAPMAAPRAVFAQPAPGYAPQPVPAPVPAPQPVVVHPAPTVVHSAPLVEPAPIIPHAEPASDVGTTAPEPAPAPAPMAVSPKPATPALRTVGRRLGPAS